MPETTTPGPGTRIFDSAFCDSSKEIDSDNVFPISEEVTGNV